MTKASDLLSKVSESVVHLINYQLPQSKLKASDPEKIKAELVKMGIQNLNMTIDGDRKVLKITGSVKASFVDPIKDLMKKYQ